MAIGIDLALYFYQNLVCEMQCNDFLNMSVLRETFMHNYSNATMQSVI